MRTPTPTLPRLAARALAGALLLAAACSSNGTAPPASGSVDATVAASTAGDGRLVGTPGAVTIVADPNDPRQAGPRDPVQIVAARLDRDTLRITAQYGGGCAQHVFRLVGGYAFAESLPVQTGLVLGHDAKGDNCRALVRAELAFSLAPLADVYRRGYNTRTGTIDVRLSGWDGLLRYTF
jgi:hypothetical protein